MVVRETLRFIADNFRMQGWQGASFTPWAPIKRKGTILVKTGALRRGFNYTNNGNGEVMFYNKIIYASVHNQGLSLKHYARTETFTRNRHTKGIKAHYFGGMGAFKKGTAQGLGNPDFKGGLSFKEYVVKMPVRQFAPTESSPSPILEADIVKWLTKDIEGILTHGR